MSDNLDRILRTQNPAMSASVTLFMCPDCGLGQTRTNTVRINETWSEWLCWECGHRFGGIADEGELDIGLVRDSQLNTNPWTNPFTEEPNP